ncbi:MAG: phosphatidate cytidylyltransferase [Planctomycetota bacterium]|nr:phosphatidate cytidylyltransferase [Planctomycetota bacterium]
MKGLGDRIRWGGPIFLVSIALLVSDQQNWTGGYGLVALSLLFGLAACIEALSFREGGAWRKWVGVSVYLLVYLGGWSYLSKCDDPLLRAVILLGIPLFLGSMLITGMKVEHRSPWLGSITAILTAIWLAIPTMTVLILAETDPLGIHAVLLGLLMVKGSDTGAYFTGRALGRTPLHPVSPKKTWEGLIGGALSAAAIGFVYALWLGSETLSGGQGIFLGVLMALVGQFADLQESAMKRAAGRKDSGNLIPGLGGALDMVDSMLLAVPTLLLVRTVLNG